MLQPAIRTLLTILIVTLLTASAAVAQSAAQHDDAMCSCVAQGIPCQCDPAMSCGCYQIPQQQQQQQNNANQPSQASGIQGSSSLNLQQQLDNKSHPLGALPNPQNIGGPERLTDKRAGDIASKTGEWMSQTSNRPEKTAAAARASGQAQSSSAANALGEVARDQAVNAIEFCSKFLANFTTEGGNKWNRIRNEIFLPIALLLLLPGAVMTQVKAIVAAGNPAIAQVSPLEGIERSVIAIFLIPGSYLIVNYGIDFANSASYTIASEYRRLFHSDMYKDAMCAEIRAFTPRHHAENDSSLKIPPFDKSPINHGLFSPIEKDWGKLFDPCVPVNLAPRTRDDGAAPADTIAKRMVLNTVNATMTTTWGILCAFQMAFFYYLFFVGPIMAALWAWPNKMLRDAFPSWVEGVVTLCFWNFFWHTTILLMGCFRGCDDTGIIMMTALNFLATASVKHAFDFVGLQKAAGQKAMELAEKMAEASSKDGGGGGGSSGGAKGGAKGGKGRKPGRATPARKNGADDSRTLVANNDDDRERDDDGDGLNERDDDDADERVRTAWLGEGDDDEEGDEDNPITLAAADTGLEPVIVQTSPPPLSGHVVASNFQPTMPPSALDYQPMARDKISSIIGASIQPVMALPAQYHDSYVEHADREFIGAASPLFIEDNSRIYVQEASPLFARNQSSEQQGSEQQGSDVQSFEQQINPIFKRDYKRIYVQEANATLNQASPAETTDETPTPTRSHDEMRDYFDDDPSMSELRKNAIVPPPPLSLETVVEVAPQEPFHHAPPSLESEQLMLQAQALLDRMAEIERSASLLNLNHFGSNTAHQAEFAPPSASGAMPAMAVYQVSSS